MNKRRRKQQKKSNSALGVLAVVLLTAIIGVGCSEPATVPAPSPPAQKSVSAVSGTAAAQHPETPAEGYSYNPAGRKDPFAPIVVKEEKKAQVGTRPPLERYPVSEFKLAGIVWGGFGYNAMLEGPDGKGYFARVGTVIGQNRGVVKKITSTSMIIEEKFKNFQGETERREIIVELRKKQEGNP